MKKFAIHKEGLENLTYTGQSEGKRVSYVTRMFNWISTQRSGGNVKSQIFYKREEIMENHAPFHAESAYCMEGDDDPYDVNNEPRIKCK